MEKCTFCSNEKMFVDLLTKGLSKVKHVKYINSIDVSFIVEQEKVQVEEIHDKDANIRSG
jgi:hypothetical protein